MSDEHTTHQVHRSSHFSAHPSGLPLLLATMTNTNNHDFSVPSNWNQINTRSAPRRGSSLFRADSLLFLDRHRFVRATRGGRTNIKHTKGCEKESFASRPSFVCDPSWTSSSPQHQVPRVHHNASFKSVRFHNPPVTAAIPSAMEDAPTSALWYSVDQYDRFKKHYMQLAKDVARIHRQETHKKSKRRTSQSSELLQVFRECEKEQRDHSLPPSKPLRRQGWANSSLQPVTSSIMRTLLVNEEDHLFLEQQDTIVGLERMAARQIANDKKGRRKTMLETIKVIQEEDIKESGDRISRSEAIRLACERLSRPSRLFAQHLAQSTAKAA